MNFERFIPSLQEITGNYSQEEASLRIATQFYVLDKYAESERHVCNVEEQGIFNKMDLKFTCLEAFFKHKLSSASQRLDNNLQCYKAFNDQTSNFF